MTPDIIPETKKGKQCLALNGHELMQLSDSQKASIACQVSDLLKLQTETMLQFTPEELIEKYINEGDAIALVTIDTYQLIGFAKNHRWPGETEKGQNLYEFGSWLVRPEYRENGYGGTLALLASQTIGEKDSDAQLVAVCSIDNPKPILILQKLGAYEIPKPANLECLLGGGKTRTVVLDMTTLDQTQL